MKTIVKIYSCYWETYSPLVNDILNDLVRTTGFSYDQENLVIERIQLDGETIAGQRNKNSRSILIYTDDELRYIIAMSNTNYDEDKLLEANKLKQDI